MSLPSSRPVPAPRHRPRVDSANDASASFAGNRGFDRVETGRLHSHLTRYRGLIACLDAELGIWPAPEAARGYCENVMGEIETELSRRAGEES